MNGTVGVGEGTCDENGAHDLRYFQWLVDGSGNNENNYGYGVFLGYDNIKLSEKYLGHWDVSPMDQETVSRCKIFH